MKNLFLVLAAAVALSAQTVKAEDHPFAHLDFHNVVNVHLAAGIANSHVATLRPYRGDLLRVRIPFHCGTTIVSNLAAVGRSLDGRQRLQLTLVGPTFQESNFQNRSTDVYYQVNFGSPATIREISFTGQTGVQGCQVAFEQSNTRTPVGPVPPSSGECAQLEQLACPLYADNSRVCHAYYRNNPVPSFSSYIEGNACQKEIDVKLKVCAAGYLPSQFRVVCN